MSIAMEFQAKYFNPNSVKMDICFPVGCITSCPYAICPTQLSKLKTFLLETLNIFCNETLLFIRYSHNIISLTK